MGKGLIIACGGGYTTKKILLLCITLALAAASNLRPLKQVSVNGERLPGLYSAAGLRQGMEAAQAAAEEIVPGHAKPATPRVRTVFSLCRAEDDIPLLCHRLLCQTEGVCLTNAVIVNGRELGRTESRGELIQALQSYIHNQMPTWASYGVINGELTLTPMYARSGTETDYSDLVLLISGMAPVLYSDYYSWA